jgi:hypothetical protein
MSGILLFFSESDKTVDVKGGNGPIKTCIVSNINT